LLLLKGRRKLCRQIYSPRRFSFYSQFSIRAISARETVLAFYGVSQRTPGAAAQ